MPLVGRESTPLPPNDFQDEQQHAAYEHCLWLERQQTWGLDVNVQADGARGIMSGMPPCIAARALGYAMRFAPCDEGREAVVQDICAYGNGLENLARLAHLYVYGLCRTFYGPKGPTVPVSTAQTPRLSLENIAKDEAFLAKSTSSRDAVRKQTLVRDKKCCIFTGYMDSQQMLLGIKAGEKYARDNAALTKVAHIITQSLGKNTQGDSPSASEKAEWARTAGAMIEQFGGLQAKELGSELLHSPMNAFTAIETAHHYFDHLQLWLTPVKKMEMDQETETIVPNTYNVEYTSDVDMVVPHLKSRITFQPCEVNGVVIPPPHPRLLALHAACAGIANMSGAAEYIEETFRDTEPIAVMTEPNAVNELTRALTVIELIRGEG